jgi:DNA-binding MarR family transcriptional regulator
MFDHCLYFNTTALARVLDRQWTQAFKAFDLTPAQAFMLRMILEKPGLLQRELAEALMIARATATRTLDGLEKKELIARMNTADGREFALHPTVKAKALKDKINSASGEVTKRLKHELGAEYFEQTVKRVKSICAVIK